MKEYLEKETCLKVSMVKTDKYYDKLPLMYKGRYIFYDMQMVGAKWIALVRGWRRIVWLAAWKLFPMTQSAQSHRQMRSIPRCSKAVFYVFVFGPIHDSTTLLNPPPPK